MLLYIPKSDCTIINPCIKKCIYTFIFLPSCMLPILTLFCPKPLLNNFFQCSIHQMFRAAIGLSNEPKQSLIGPMIAEILMDILYMTENMIMKMSFFLSFVATAGLQWDRHCAKIVNSSDRRHLQKSKNLF
jgi:hypothetical protein